MRQTFVLFLLLTCSSQIAHGQIWSLRARTQPIPPQFSDNADQSWIQNPIDAFVLDRLRQKKLQPASQADRGTLIRRLTFDLTGLPPTPDEIDHFVNDTSVNAYERLVERLLASPHYGERWAQHWLDVVRFAESEGFEYDRHLTGAWRYRDFVIDSLNQDKPYDRFVTEQLAGDLLEPKNQQMQIAVGFLRLGPIRRNAGNQKVAFSRNEVLTEMTDTIGMVFLAMTVGCARCHDHKFDDVTQKDYYQLQAFLAGTHEKNVQLASAPEQAQWKKETDRLTAQIKNLKTQVAEATGVAKEKLQTKLRNLEAKLPTPLPTICTVAEIPKQRTAIHVLKRGMPEKKGERVQPAFPSPLASWSKSRLSPKAQQTSRVALAQWLTDPEHPLTARVMVNRLWQYHFGRAIVDTPNDFGSNGAKPTHPELLDYLANQFVAHGMRFKPLHRQIVLSSTYRQSSHSQLSRVALKIDPENRLLWRFPRRRLSAEEIRDSMLVASGRLNETMSGPSVILPVDKDLVQLLYNPAQWQVTADRRQHDRRSIYLMAKRNLRHPFAQIFDQPDLQTSCPRREVSTHSLQALELLNGKTSNRLAVEFAKRLQEKEMTTERQIEEAFLWTVGRAPNSQERELAENFLKDQPLRELVLALFNLNAFLYVD